MPKIHAFTALFLIVFLFIATTSVWSQPDWVVTFGHSKKYPQSMYLVGFGSAPGKGEESSQIAQDNARAAVSRQIIVNIQSLIQTAEEENNQKVSEYYSSITQSSTALQLMGLQTELSVESEPPNPTTYALAYVSRAELNRIYEKRRSNLHSQIRRIIADAQAAENNSRTAEAVTKYLSLYPLYAELKEVESILLVAKQSTSIDTAFDELAGETTSSGSPEPPLMSLTEIINRVDQLVSQSMRSVDDVVRAVVFQLSKQVSQPEGNVLIAPVTYQNTKISSHFAYYLLAALETQMGQMVKWNAVSQTMGSTRGFSPKSTQITQDLAKDTGATWLLSGTYWELGEQIKLLVDLRHVNTGKVLAGAEVLFDANLLKSANLDLKPQNFERALIEQKAFAEGEFISGNLHVEVWTNKGNENLLFTEEEIMKVYVRVNREAYIRLLYILADGQRTLLYDNYYIDQSKVNHAVEIPEKFECAPPFGAEMLVVLARTAPFERVETVEVDGYDVLKAATAQEAAAKVRGMKRKQKKAFDSPQAEIDLSDVQQSEVKIVITTMKK